MHQSPRPTAPGRPIEGHIDVDGIRLHYVDWGTPDQFPVLFLHGGSAHARWWDFLVPHLADRYRCLALDLRGHGDSDWSSSADYGLETHAADVTATIEALDLPRVAIVGHSFGGFVAMTFAPGASRRLAALVIVDSRAAISERSARFLDALRKLPQPHYDSLEEAIRRFRLLPVASMAEPDILAHVARHGMRRDPDGTWTLKFDRRAMSGAGPRDFFPGLAAVHCPLLVVRGADSEIVPRAGLTEFRAANPRAVTAEIAAAHHHVMLDRPAELARVVGAFLDALPL